MLFVLFFAVAGLGQFTFSDWDLDGSKSGRSIGCGGSCPMHPACCTSKECTDPVRACMMVAYADCLAKNGLGKGQYDPKTQLRACNPPGYHHADIVRTCGAGPVPCDVQPYAGVRTTVPRYSENRRPTVDYPLVATTVPRYPDNPRPPTSDRYAPTTSVVDMYAPTNQPIRRRYRSSAQSEDIRRRWDARQQRRYTQPRQDRYAPQPAPPQQYPPI